MIRINLLGVERPKAKAGFTFDASQRVAAGCALVLIATVAGIGWWYWSLTQASARLDEEMAQAQQQQIQLQTVLTEVQRAEQLRAQLQQRVTLIQQLRGGQSVPVQLLDHVSRSLPDALWLTQMSQNAGEVTIQGRSTTLIELSNFVAGLGDSGLLRRPIEIVDSRVESVTGSSPQQGPPVELINFTVKAQVGADAAAPAAAAN
jgi:type IV pilus assembly protein PilN